MKGYEPPRLERKALVHGHCHHKSVMGMDDETELLKKIGLDFHMPEDGCCGMAGSFGFERGGHYEVSVACGERVLLPAVRKQERDTLIIANGFSCQQQIEQTTDRKALHLAQVLQMALQEGPRGPTRQLPEKWAAHDGHAPRLMERAATAAVLGAGAVGVGLIAWDLIRRASR